MLLSIENQSVLEKLFMDTPSVSFTVTEERTDRHNQIVRVDFNVAVSRKDERTFCVDIRTNCAVVRMRRHDWEEDCAKAIGDPNFSVEGHEHKNLKQLVYRDTHVCDLVGILVYFVEVGLSNVSFYQRGLATMLAGRVTEAGSYPTPEAVLLWLRSPQAHT